MVNGKGSQFSSCKDKVSRHGRGTASSKSCHFLELEYSKARYLGCSGNLWEPRVPPKGQAEAVCSLLVTALADSVLALAALL